MGIQGVSNTAQNVQLTVLRKALDLAASQASQLIETMDKIPAVVEEQGRVDITV